MSGSNLHTLCSHRENSRWSQQGKQKSWRIFLTHLLTTGHDQSVSTDQAVQVCWPRLRTWHLQWSICAFHVWSFVVQVEDKTCYPGWNVVRTNLLAIVLELHCYFVDVSTDVTNTSKPVLLNSWYTKNAKTMLDHSYDVKLVTMIHYGRNEALVTCTDTIQVHIHWHSVSSTARHFTYMVRAEED